MNWTFYRNRLLYILPFYLIISVLAYLLIAGVINRAESKNTEIINVFRNIIVFELIILWLITPFTFLFLESFKTVKRLFSFEINPNIDFPSDTSEFARKIIRIIAFVPHFLLLFIKYSLSCYMVILLNFIVSPLVILALMVEKVIKFLGVRKNKGNKS